MVERTSSTRSQYLSPTVETVLGYSDEEYEPQDLNRRSTVSLTSSSKKPSRRRHKAHRAHSMSSTSLAERERRREARHSQNPSGTTKSSPLREDSASSSWSQSSRGLTDRDALKKEVDQHSPRLGEIVNMQTGGEAPGLRRPASTGSLASSNSVYSVEAEQGDECDERDAELASDGKSRPVGTSPYHVGGKPSASVVSNLTSLSGMTNSSGGSSGSNSTVTQDSASKTRRPRPQQFDPDAAASAAAPETSEPRVKAAPNVFEYMEEGSATLDKPVEWSTRPTSASSVHPPARSPSNETGPSGLTDMLEEKETSSNSSNAGSFHSDSGISIRDESPDRMGPLLAGKGGRSGKGKLSARDVFEPIFARQRERLASGLSAAAQFRLPTLAELREPRSTPADFDLSNPEQVGLPGSWESSPNMPFVKPHRSSAPSEVIHEEGGLSGYGLLASSLSSGAPGTSSNLGSVMPLYRKFETLNHRLFLHLQDEITELEEELGRIDEADAHTRRTPSPGGTSAPRPASRRAASRYAKEIDWRRIDVLGRVFTKVGHYNQALSSYATLLKTLDPPNSQDIEAYRGWMATHNPIAEAEAQFLRHDSDLLALTSISSSPSLVSSDKPTGYGDPAKRLLLMVAVGAVLLPVLTFGIVPSLPARIIIVLIIAGASLAILAQSHRCWPLLEPRCELGTAV
ncbi:MAG: hypothetical protein M1838_001748 [Thelocarpon superellum]|nr:MAG: hypothetical protein M1838_001748 [Thelocarpon superellum]